MKKANILYRKQFLHHLQRSLIETPLKNISRHPKNDFYNIISESQTNQTILINLINSQSILRLSVPYSLHSYNPFDQFLMRAIWYNINL